MNKKRTVLPLLGTAFSPGKAAATIKEMEDRELAEIAQAESYYFSAHMGPCVEIAEKYLQNEDQILRLSADVLCIFGNLTLGNPENAREAWVDVSLCAKKAFEESENAEIQAQCLFALYIVRVLFHIPPKYDFPPLRDYLHYLSEGQRLFAIHMMAHSAYLHQAYERGQGMLQAAQAMSNVLYPIPAIYGKCLDAVCNISQKRSSEAKASVLDALEMASPDHFLEPFIEYHGLMQGVLEVCIKQYDQRVYKRLMEGVVAFSRGWMQIHNPETRDQVTDLLTPVEFSIAMLACRDWTNQEIAEHMHLSVNTVKHYISTILEKLQIERRIQIREFVNQ